MMNLGDEFQFGRPYRDLRVQTIGMSARRTNRRASILISIVRLGLTLRGQRPHIYTRLSTS
jgi:hypothetical protein